MEVTKVYKDLDITYGELAKALIRLNFKNNSTEKVFAYVNQKYDAIVLLPMKKETEMVDKAQFASISFVLTGKGLINEQDELAKWVEHYRQQLKKGATV